MEYMKLFVVLALVLSICSMPSCSEAAVTFTVTAPGYGAKGDGITDSTSAFQRAWIDACNCNQQAILFVPAGTYLVNPLNLNGPCKNNPLLFKIQGTIAPRTIQPKATDAWIHFTTVSGIQLQGGVLDGKGKTLWDCKKTRRTGCPQGAASLQFSNCDHVTVTGLTSKDSEFFHIHISDSKHVWLQTLIITAPADSLNTDGIHVSRSDDVHILGSNISTGDDCVSVGPGTTGLTIDNIHCGPGHGISIGSLGLNGGEAGVENVTVTGCTFTGTQNGLRIKTFPRPNTGFVRQVTYQHITMINAQNPIIIDQHYCNGQDQTCPGPGSGVKISNIKYIDIHGTSATPISTNFNCSQTNHCMGLFLQTIRLNGRASCAAASGTTSGIITPQSCLAK